MFLSWSISVIWHKTDGDYYLQFIPQTLYLSISGGQGSVEILQLIFGQTKGLLVFNLQADVRNFQAQWSYWKYFILLQFILSHSIGNRQNQKKGEVPSSQSELHGGSRGYPWPSYSHPIQVSRLGALYCDGKVIPVVLDGMYQGSRAFSQPRSFRASSQFFSSPQGSCLKGTKYL